MDQQTLQYESVRTHALSQTIFYAGLKLFGVYLIYVSVSLIPACVIGYFHYLTTPQNGLNTDYNIFTTNLVQLITELICGCILFFFARSISDRFILPLGQEISDVGYYQWVIISVIFVGVLVTAQAIPEFIISASQYIQFMFKGRGRYFTSTITNLDIPFYRSGLSICLGLILILRPSWIAGRIQRYSRFKM